MSKQYVPKARLNIEKIVADIKELDEKDVTGFVLVAQQEGNKVTFNLSSKGMSHAAVIGALEQFKFNFFASTRAKIERM